MTTAASVRQVRRAAWRAGVSLGRTVARPTAAKRPLPDYLIIGGQRCGTTSLHHYLARHPCVLPARFTKGVHWFDVAFDKPESWYRTNFATEAKRRSAAGRLGHPVVTGEASPYYLFHPEVPQRVASAMPDVKVIALLRDPVERAWSQFHHEVRRGFEDLDFDAAIEAEAHRLAGAEAILAEPGGHHFSHQHHSYVARGRYVEQLDRWRDHFPADRMLVLFSADLEDATAATMAQVHRFLDLPEAPTATNRQWNNQAKRELGDPVKTRLRAAFADSDRALADRLARALPWPGPHSGPVADGAGPGPG